jgi:medium-chain acyl-[acyl-carrier-protein] hydrolase
MMDAGPWLSQLPRGDGSVALLCLPHAGGGAHLYRDWVDAAPPRVHVCPVELPGHGTRFGVRSLTSISAMVVEAAAVLRPVASTPFALFGHSMGAHRLRARARVPSRLRPKAPARVRRRRARAAAAADGSAGSNNIPVVAVARARRYPPEVLGNEALLNLLEPVLRADLLACDTYMHVTERSLECPITASAASTTRASAGTSWPHGPRTPRLGSI